MQQLEEIYYRSRIIHGDLYAADEQLSGQIGPGGTWIPFLKNALVALGNLMDLEGSLRRLYNDHHDLATQIKKIERDLQFAKYLRNVFAGHINCDLLAKSYEWRPELRKMPGIRELDGTVMLNVFVLETAINTYVASDGTHGMFDSETDLVYPPDMKRFCTWLSNAIRASIAVCDLLGSITHKNVAQLGDLMESLEVYKAAGLTEFARIRKGRV